MLQLSIPSRIGGSCQHLTPAHGMRSRRRCEIRCLVIGTWALAFPAVNCRAPATAGPSVGPAAVPTGLGRGKRFRVEGRRHFAGKLTRTSPSAFISARVETAEEWPLSHVPIRRRTCMPHSRLLPSIVVELRTSTRGPRSSCISPPATLYSVHAYLLDRYLLAHPSGLITKAVSDVKRPFEQPCITGHFDDPRRPFFALQPYLDLTRSRPQTTCMVQRLPTGARHATAEPRHPSPPPPFQQSHGRHLPSPTPTPGQPRITNTNKPSSPISLTRQPRRPHPTQI
ncbi:hypothetical protein BT67DRAFT_408301 [Trichocladium antarcticum]|uniref:Uncharacterized protein n=1 Tax=Trichocladium antarcticum TaxID=1450529 RepID=A0AAN6ZAB3_9PEZI|nr:hypothetical protein BT67DRAFT_408301 [Trichocladium antarcticum]